MTISLTALARLFSALTVASLFFYGAFDKWWWVSVGLYSGEWDIVRGLILGFIHLWGLFCFVAWLPDKEKRRGLA